jgi:hypothetical protein
MRRPCGFEDAVLLGLRQAREQRQDLGAAAACACAGVGRLADLALAGQEDQDVAGPRARARPPHRQMASLRSYSRFPRRPVALLHREHAARDHDHRRRALGRGEVLGKAVGVDGGRGDDHLQVGPARQDLRR